MVHLSFKLAHVVFRIIVKLFPLPCRAKMVSRGRPKAGRPGVFMMDLEQLLGENANFLTHQCKTISKEKIYAPGPDFIDRVFKSSDRGSHVLRNLSSLFNAGRLAKTGYLNILPVDQGVEHSAGASFAPNPEYFDPKQIVELAIEGGCNAVASTHGVLASVARDYAHKIPFILKLNHNETLSLPTTYDQVIFARVKDAFDMGAIGVGATIYWGSKESHRQLKEIGEAFSHAHSLGLFTILWCYLRNNAFKKDGIDYHAAGDLSGQANHLGASLGADIIKQKLPTNNGGYTAINFGHTSPLVYSKLSSDHPIDLTRYQVANCYMGRIGLINSGGPSGKDDLSQAVLTAVINKRAGGMGLISGRKAFQKPFADGVKLLHAIQDVYLDKRVSIA